MWDQSGYDNAGGFMGMTGTQPGTPSSTQGGERRKRAQNLVPMEINEILSANEDGVKIEDQEVGMVDILGTIQSVEQSATKTVYVLKDNTGTIDAVHWADSDTGTEEGTKVSEGMLARVIGSCRSQQGTKHVMIFRISPVESDIERDSHALECKYVKLKLRQLKEKENRAIGMNMSGVGSGLSNSMMGGGMGATTMKCSSFQNSKHDLVFGVLSACHRDEGMSRVEMMQELRPKLSRVELDDALDYLSGEGHIYSTTDDDHFKTTDA